MGEINQGDGRADRQDRSLELTYVGVRRAVVGEQGNDRHPVGLVAVARPHAFYARVGGEVAERRRACSVKGKRIHRGRPGPRMQRSYEARSATKRVMVRRSF